MNERLVKILNLTQSDNDHEALSAMRMANSMLKKAGKTWNDVLDCRPRAPGIFDSPEHPNCRSTDVIFADINADMEEVLDWLRKL